MLINNVLPLAVLLQAFVVDVEIIICKLAHHVLFFGFDMRQVGLVELFVLLKYSILS